MRRVKELGIELSSMCNAACPQCLRELYFGDYSRFEQTYIPTEFFETRIPQHVYDDIDHFWLSGDLGDPCTAPNLFEVIKVFKERSPTAQITIHTNGGMKGSEYWRELAQHLSPYDTVQFAIDGLEDTNHIYRVNVKWSKLMENVQAFISEGGRASWQFVIFKHNEHQVDEARELSQKMGFEDFFTKITTRFFHDEITGTKRYGDGGVLLEPTTRSEYQSIAFIKTDFKKFNSDKWIKDTEDAKVTCSMGQYDQWYIDYRGRLFRCGFIASSLISRERLGTINDQWDEIWANYGGDRLNLNLYDWDDVINSQFFKEVERTWTDKAPNKIITCVSTCSDWAKRL